MSRIQTLYLIHHSHTDIGYTHDQPVVLDLHERFITTALNLADRDADPPAPEPSAGRWRTPSSSPAGSNTRPRPRSSAFRPWNGLGGSKSRACSPTLRPCWTPTS